MRFVTKSETAPWRMMHGILQRLDDALIDGIFQPWVERTAAYLPMDCFGQARICTRLSAVAWILSQAGGMVTSVRSRVVGLQVTQAALLLLGLAAIMVLHTLFQQAGSVGSSGGRANPFRVTMFMHRIIILSGLIVGIVKRFIGLGSLALLAVAFFATAAIYIGACSNPPPKHHVSVGRRPGAVARYGSAVP